MAKRWDEPQAGRFAVIPQPQPPAEPALQGVDFRTSPRYRVLQRCFVRPPGVRPPDGWRGIVFNLSANGIGVTLPLAVERGTDLDIEAWNLPGAPDLAGPRDSHCPITIRLVDRLRIVATAGRR